MQLGAVMAPAILAGSPGEWRFVTSDAHGVAQRVRTQDVRARLVANVLDGRLAVAVLVPPAAFEGDRNLPGAGDAGGAWLISFFPKRGGQYMHGEPDATVLEEMRRRDAHRLARGLDPRKIRAHFERLSEAREEMAERHGAEVAEAMVERYLFEWARRTRRPWAPNRIYVP